jgi:CubicO group peptidase (beta-lactamase class C family)
MSTTAFSKSRLARLRDVLAGYVEREEMPGLVAIVCHQGETHVETIGTLSFGDASPMRRDTIFRIASMSKPVVAAAAMILVEECKIRLDDSIEQWIPELANRRVLVSMSSLDETVPAERAITLRDLLTFRMGFGSVMAMPGAYPIQKKIRENEIGGDGPPHPDRAPATDEWLRRLGSLPWMAQPGSRWFYHTSSDVLGVLIARLSGQSLGEFLRERFFAPLGMKDTGFFVPAEKRDRLPTSYVANRPGKRLGVFDDVADSSWGTAPAFESAGGGLVSTADDYFAFCQMMLNRGRHGQEQILSPATVELMTQDHVPPEQRVGAEIFFGTNRSWGFGLAIDLRQEEIYNTPGRFGWDGGLGTSAYTDPAKQMIGILLTQRMMDSPTPPRFYTDFWTLAYAAMT